MSEQPPIYDATMRLFIALEQLESSFQQKNSDIITENEQLRTRISELEHDYRELQTVSEKISDKLDMYIEKLAGILGE